MIPKLMRWRDVDKTWETKPDDGLRWFVKIKHKPDDVACDFALTKVEIDKKVAQKFGFKIGELTPFTGLLIEGEKI